MIVAYFRTWPHGTFSLVGGTIPFLQVSKGLVEPIPLVSGFCLIITKSVSQYVAKLDLELKILQPLSPGLQPCAAGLA